MAELPPEPNPTMLKLWAEVGEGVDKSQTVNWRGAVHSLKLAHTYLLTCDTARTFAERYTSAVVGILLDQHYGKIGREERNCVQEALHHAVTIVAVDLRFQLQQRAQHHAAAADCKLLPTLEVAFDPARVYYRGVKGSWHVGTPGFPDARINAIERFRRHDGFQLLAEYVAASVAPSDSIDTGGLPVLPPPSLLLLHLILTALQDTLKVPPTPSPPPPRGVPSPVAPPAAPDQPPPPSQRDAIRFGEAVMRYLGGTGDDALKRLATEQIADLQADLRHLFDRFLAAPGRQRHVTLTFYAYWRDFCLKLLSSGSLPLKLFGWEQLGEMLDACAAQRPPPRHYVVAGAGCTFCNGRYDFSGSVTEEGYVVPGEEIKYVHQTAAAVDAADGPAPESATPAKGTRKLTLFRCTMRSSHKWWFLSEPDEEQPGTDKDIDYYQHKSKESEAGQPPCTGWMTCRDNGVDPPPVLEAHGVMVPPGEEFNTLDHQLAQWAIENEIVEQVLGDTTIHREVVARSTVLIKFLAAMCDRYKVPADYSDTRPEPTKYCLQSSHLLYAWKTCLRKADAAVSSQVYQLLVSVLPLCPADLANPLLQAVQTSLRESDDQKDHLFEVAGFCSALASGILNASVGDVPLLKEEVREEVLSLLWSVLTHPNASSLKTYDTLKRYVTHELRVEPKGREHRDKLMQACTFALSQSSGSASGPFDERQALRMVGLTKFVLDACPREQAIEIVTSQDGALLQLIFDELKSYLQRRKVDGSNMITKTSSTQLSAIEEDAKLYSHALDERLHILRHVYGLSDLSQSSESSLLRADMVQNLWELCDGAGDRETLMVFIAQASRNSKVLYEEIGPRTAANHGSGQQEQQLFAAFTEDVALSLFLDLFCSQNFDYEFLGDAAYKSFQCLFIPTRLSSCLDAHQKKRAIDALWRFCLTVGDDGVATLAMKDLLDTYVTRSSVSTSNHIASAHENDPLLSLGEFEDFGERVFQCLTTVKHELESGGRAANRSTERCLRILNAAAGHSSLDGRSMYVSTIIRLSCLKQQATLDDILKIVPHGMRGQGSYRRVGILVKRPQVQQTQSQSEHSTTGRNSNSKFTLDLHPLETLGSMKQKVAINCQCTLSSVKPIQVTGRAVRAVSAEPQSNFSLNTLPEDTTVDELGIVEGCEIVFVIADSRQQTQGLTGLQNSMRTARVHDLSDIFFGDDGSFFDRLFNILMEILKLISRNEKECITGRGAVESNGMSQDANSLVWDFLLATPTNQSIAAQVKSAARHSLPQSAASNGDTMEVEPVVSWPHLLDSQNFDRSVYVLLTIDAMLRPAGEVLSILSSPQREQLIRELETDAVAFKNAFVNAGGFQCVVHFFSASGSTGKTRHGERRRGNAVALRILKSCLFGDGNQTEMAHDNTPSEIRRELLDSLSDVHGLVASLLLMVIEDSGISSSTISDVLRFLSLLFQSPTSSNSFMTLPGEIWEQFFVKALVYEEDLEKSRSSSSIGAALHVRRLAHDLILHTSVLADIAVPWLTRAIADIGVASDCSAECFDVVEKLISDGPNRMHRSQMCSDQELGQLSLVVCQKLMALPRPGSESEAMDLSTGVLCGCLKLLRAIVETGRLQIIQSAIANLVLATGASRWSEGGGESKDDVLLDLMGVIFDSFLTPTGASAVSVCCDKESRGLGFEVIEAAARQCCSDKGFAELISRIESLISRAALHMRHMWGRFGYGNTDSITRTKNGSTKYSGLKNAGCTCYMNSVLQQLFMMPDIRNSLCSATLPTNLRSSGDSIARGSNLIGKRISLQWEANTSYDAVVESFNDETGMHCIRYCPVPVASFGAPNHHSKIDPDEIARLPPNLPDEFILTEGRPGKETGVFEILEASDDDDGNLASRRNEMDTESPDCHDTCPEEVSETEDERASRRLLEEVQRTFVYLEEGARGQHFDPKGLIEACGCLKLEFDVFQQNDASEFATKLLDRLEISLKKWAPTHFQYMDHTFGIKQIKQKICRECGLKTNREEKLLNIDCQIRGKNDIHEALATFTETEIMEGSNKVFCETCGKNTDTVLRTAISTLPNMLILSLKRFDLDFNTFETVKLNSRCAFGQTLNMKEYTLEGLEATEKDAGSSSPMDTDDDNHEAVNSLSDQNDLHDEDFEYRLAGVLVHAGVAQGGHYYSFIRERGSDKWYRFDDEDVTPFDPTHIETECFGGRVKKETKWPNGQTHTVEQEQFANALMLFYEKVKPSDPTTEALAGSHSVVGDVLSGYDVYRSDVLRSISTHRWQALLFDSEFQFFLKRLYKHSTMADSGDSMQNVNRRRLFQMLLGYFFDIILYSADKGHINEWSGILEQACSIDLECGKNFVHRLAKKTTQIASNWFRTSLLECPDQTTRTGAVRIFSAAIRSCLSFQEERNKLIAWTNAWDEQILSLRTKAFIAPSVLTQQWATFEDTSNLESGEASSIGILVSHLNVLLDALPRCWRFSSEPLQLIRLLAAITIENEYLLRSPLIASLMPMRLIAIALRDRLPSNFREAFPGTSLSQEASNTQIRLESSHVHVVSMSGGQLHNETGQRGPGPDFACIIEALTSIASLPGSLKALLVVDSGQVVRGRRCYVLSDAATQALSIVFQENSSPQAPGMTRQEVEAYMDHCGIEKSHATSQKISDMMKKYSLGDENAKGGKYLTLNGFLAYYRETVQSNDVQLRDDLNVFGFRPDLSRRSTSSRLLQLDGHVSLRDPAESIAIDVGEVFGEQSVTFGVTADLALSLTITLYDIAFKVSEAHALYLLAAVSYKRDPTELINRMLSSIYGTSTDWQGNDRVLLLTQSLKVLACVPDQYQNSKIGLVMESTEPLRQADCGIGLLHVLRALQQARSLHPYNQEVQWLFTRYIKIVRDLRKSYAFFKWMQANRANWAFVERDLVEDQEPLHHHYMHNEFTTRDDTGMYNSHLIGDRALGQADMDIANMQDESEDDEDSRFGDPLFNGAPLNDNSDLLLAKSHMIEIHGAGSAEVNGVYRQSGYFQGGHRYTRVAPYKNKMETFSLYQCNASDNTKHWYISVVPEGSNPGTSADTDFYSAPCGADRSPAPPRTGWLLTGVGCLPVPSLTIVEVEDEDFGLYPADGDNTVPEESFA